MSQRPFQVAGEILYHSEGMVQTRPLDWMHYQAHEGQLYSTGIYWTIANGATALTTFHAGTIMPHGIFEIAVGGNCKFTMTEGGTITGGTAVTIINHKRSSSNVPVGSASHSGTLTGGTAIVTEYIPGGDKTFGSGGAARSEHEIIGLVGKSYTAQLVNISGGEIQASVNFLFYELNL